MEPNLNNYKLWLKFLKQVAKFFEEEGFLEVKTPTLVPSGAMEASLETLMVENSCYLPTSPEFSLKKLWLSDTELGSIFELSPSFRKEELGKLHLTEFTMLEFYRSGEDLQYLKSLVAKFFNSLFQDNLKFSEASLAVLFEATSGFKILPDSSRAFLAQVCEFHGIDFKNTYSWNDLYQLIYIELIEPVISRQSPIFLTDYPPQIAALAKINDKGWADRVEVFYQGVELGNGYNELFDDQELSRRWQFENSERVKDGKKKHPIDDDLISLHKNAFFNQGVGMAIGLERIFSIVTALKSDESQLSSIRTWPFY